MRSGDKPADDPGPARRPPVPGPGTATARPSGAAPGVVAMALWLERGLDPGLPPAAALAAFRRAFPAAAPALLGAAAALALRAMRDRAAAEEADLDAALALLRARGVTPAAPGPSGRGRAAVPVPFQAGEGAGEAGHRLPLLPVGDAGEVAHEIEQHAPLPGRRRHLPVPAEEVADLDPERPGEQEQPPGREPVGAGLVLVQLLVGDAQHRRHLLHREAEREAALARALPDQDVERAGAGTAPPGPGLGTVSAGSAAAIIA